MRVRALHRADVELGPLRARDAALVVGGGTARGARVDGDAALGERQGRGRSAVVLEGPRRKTGPGVVLAKIAPPRSVAVFAARVAFVTEPQATIWMVGDP
jgi:hypothetical protein